MSPNLHVHVSMFPCFLASMFPCLHFSMSPCVCPQISMFPSPCPCLHVSANGKRNQWKMATSLCFLTENRKVKLPLFAANRNGKRKFVFLPRQTINENQRLLFQQTWPSIHPLPTSCLHFNIQGGAMNHGLLFACPPPPPLEGCERKD